METQPTKRIKLSTTETANNSSSRSIKGTSKLSFELDSSDFSKIVGRNGFVDKTLLIKCLFENTRKVLITAPRRFGKTTNLDMVKRFLEIKVDASGRPIDTSTTLNYKIFAENKLQIFKHEQFCKQHLGKHPVIAIDFKSFRELDDFENMLSQYKLILRKTYEDHDYLLDVPNLWSNNMKLDRFKLYIDPKKNEKLDVYDIKCGFIFLAEVLHKYFGKPVFLLIDEYDSYFSSFMLKDNPDMARIITFVQSATADLLKSSNHIDHALITGVVRLSSEGLPLTFSHCLSGITHYKFLHKNPFYMYFGLTSKELDKLLKAFIKDENEKGKCRKTLDKYYNGYEIINKNIKIYSFWSILQFFVNNRKVRSAFCRDDYINTIKSIFRVDRISNKVHQLLLGMYVECDNSKQLSKTNILLLRDSMKSLEYTDSSEDLLFVFLYHLGYLSIAKVIQEPIISLKIPNQEVFFQFAKLLKDSYQLKYNFDPKRIEKFQSASNLFHKTRMNDENFEVFCKSLNDVCINSTYASDTNDTFSPILFIFLACKFSFVKSLNIKSTTHIYKDFMAINDNDIALLIHTKKVNLETLGELALQTYNKFFDEKSYDILLEKQKNKLRGQVCISACFGLNKKVSVAYSFTSKDDNNTQHPKESAEENKNGNYS